MLSADNLNHALVFMMGQQGEDWSFQQPGLLIIIVIHSIYIHFMFLSVFNQFSSLVRRGQARLLQELIPAFHDLIAHGKSTLDGYDIIAKNPKSLCRL